MKKFRTRPFRKWLDALAATVVKTRDDYTCQIRQSPNCAGVMSPRDRNCQWCHIKSRTSNNLRWLLFNALTGCGACHQWAHANPNEFGVWFSEKYSLMNSCINLPREHFTWHEDDFLKIEAGLLEKAMDYEVRWWDLPTAYQVRFKRKIAELRRNDYGKFM